MTAVERLIAAARAEVGYLEKATNAQLDSKTANAGSGNWTKYARDLDELGDFFNGRKNGYSWCAVFVLWLFVRSFSADTARAILGLPKKSLAAGVKYLAGYMQKVGRFSAVDAAPGDLIFFYKKDLKSWAHVGLVERVEGGRVFTIEGNTTGGGDKTSSVIANGGGVARKNYSLKYKRIAGYGAPDWGLLTAGEEDEEDMTGEEIYKRLTEFLLSQKPPQWVEEQGEFKRAVELGITDGSEPTRLTTRYETAIMVERALEKAGR